MVFVVRAPCGYLVVFLPRPNKASSRQTVTGVMEVLEESHMLNFELGNVLWKSLFIH